MVVVSRLIQFEEVIEISLHFENHHDKSLFYTLFVLFIITFLRRLFLILNQNQLAELFSKFSTIIFFIYWFGFLIYWDYISISKNEYISVLFSIPLLFTGTFMVYREFKRKENKNYNY